MGSMTNVLEDALLGHLVTAAYSAPTALFVALTTADPTDTATTLAGIEVANSNAYARTAITFAAAASRRVVQSGAVTFPQASGTWGTVTHWALVTSATHGAGTCLAYGNFTSSFAPVNGNTPTIPTGEIEVEISATAGGAGFTDYTVHNWLNLAFRNIAFPKPATYVGLSLTGALTDAIVTGAAVGEVANSNSYTRVLVNITGGASPAWGPISAGSGTVQNLHAITFPTPTGSWGLVASCFLADVATHGAGNILAYDSTNIVDQTPVQDDTVQFAIGALDMTIS